MVVSEWVKICESLRTWSCFYYTFSCPSQCRGNRPVDCGVNPLSKCFSSKLRWNVRLPSGHGVTHPHDHPPVIPGTQGPMSQAWSPLMSKGTVFLPFCLASLIMGKASLRARGKHTHGSKKLSLSSSVELFESPEYVKSISKASSQCPGPWWGHPQVMG